MIAVSLLLLAALALSTLGCVALWRRHVYFADGLGHTSLLAIIIASSLSLHPMAGAAIVALIFAIMIFKLHRKEDSGATIALVSSFLISLAVIINRLSPAPSDLRKLLFGNISLVQEEYIIPLVILNMLVYFYLYKFGRAILLYSLNADFAKVKRIKTGLIDFGYLILLASGVFLNLKIIGGLLLPGFLIIAPLCASLIAATPKKMIIFSNIFAVIFVSGGYGFANAKSLPASATIIFISSIFYFLLFFINKRKKITILN